MLLKVIIIFLLGAIAIFMLVDNGIVTIEQLEAIASKGIQFTKDIYNSLKSTETTT